jgi:hypothetical protein
MTRNFNGFFFDEAVALIDDLLILNLETRCLISTPSNVP